jgi:hypothetical protein
MMTNFGASFEGSVGWRENGKRSKQQIMADYVKERV